jgi:hypothetical protein
MQVAADEHISGVRQGHDATGAARRSPKGDDGAAQCRE